jgi:hypothetical protein
MDTLSINLVQRFHIVQMLSTVSFFFGFAWVFSSIQAFASNTFSYSG